MTPIECPHCHGQTVYVPDLAGQVVACPHCGGHLCMTMPEARPKPLPAAKPLPSAVAAAPMKPAAPAATYAVAPAAPQHDRSKSAGGLIALMVVLGVGGLGACFLIAAVGLYFLLAVPPVEKPVAEVQPVAESAPTTSEIVAQFPPPTVVEFPQIPPGKFPPEASRPPQVPQPALPFDPFNEPHITESGGGGVPSSDDLATNLPAASGAPAPVPPPTLPVEPQIEVVRPASPAVASLKQVVKQAELPTLASAVAEPITPLGVPQPDQIRLRLLSTAADIPDKAAFFTLPSTNNPLVWEVSYTPDLESESPKSVLLGSFIVSAENVSFQWRQPFSDPELRRQLKNCVLTIEADNQLAQLALRKPLSTEQIKLDLNRDKQLQEFALTDLPKKSRVFAEIQGEGFPVETTGGTLSKTLPVGPDEETKFDQLPGAELGLKLATDASGLNLTVAPRFREKSQLIPLSRPKLKATKEAMEQAIVKTKNEIREESAKIKNLQSQIRNLPTVAPGSPAAVQRGVTLNRLEQSVKRAANRLSTLQRQLPAMEARLKAVPTVDAFIDKLDGRQLSVQIYADCGDYRLSLVVASPAAGSGAFGEQSSRTEPAARDTQLAMTVME